MRTVSQAELAAPGARSLIWHGGALVDVAAGWMRYTLDGAAPVRRYSGYGRGFDAAVQAPAGDVVALPDVVVSTSAEVPDTDEPGRLGPCMLARRSTARQQFAWTRQLGETAGDLLPVGDSILALYQCPRLYDATTGDLQAEWAGLHTGQADSPIVGDKAFSGPARVAVDERRQRFAVADEDRITVIQLG